jgi:AhpC/TSA family
MGDTKRDKAPAFSLKDPECNVVSSTKLLSQGPLVVTFDRDVWRPYCNMDLQALQAALPESEKYGASLIAISPRTQANSRRSVRQNKLTFPILSDPHSNVAVGLRISFQAARLPHRPLPKCLQRQPRCPQRRSELDAADAGALRDRPGWNHSLRRSEPGLRARSRS